LACAVTVCDQNYTILYVNDRSAEVNQKDGGKALVGRNMLDCHPPDAQVRLKAVMASGRPNIYTIEKVGIKKMIYQAHWKKGGEVAGLVEISFELPAEIPHRVRT
jgi:transcriptional regulator with PAS, ATPase and Fis domain